MDTTEIIVARAPGRITFCGGGSDVSPIPEKFGGVCVNASINKYATTKFRWREDDVIELYDLKSKEKLKFTINDISRIDRNFPKFQVFDIPLSVIRLFAEKLKHGFNLWTLSDIGLHSGLGTSAARFASTVGVFNEALNLRLTKAEVAETAFYLENHQLGNTTGRQDQYAAVFGGFNKFEFNGGHAVKINPLNLTHDVIHELRDNLLLFFLFPRATNAGQIEQDKVKTFNSVTRFEPVLKVKQLALDATAILLSGNLSGFAELLHDNWEEKKKHSQLVSNAKIDHFYDDIRASGALAGKVIGAGAGGHMLVFCSPLNKIKVIQKAESLGAKLIDFDLTAEGLITWRSNWHSNEITS